MRARHICECRKRVKCQMAAEKREKTLRLGSRYSVHLSGRERGSNRGRYGSYLQRCTKETKEDLVSWQIYANENFLRMLISKHLKKAN